MTSRLHELRSILLARSIREESLRAYIRALPTEDRALFFRLARNHPGPGPSITRPEHFGFARIAEVTSALKDGEAESVQEFVIAAPFFDDASRERMFREGIQLVHRLSANFTIYVGRTFIRQGAEHVGPVTRWRQHRDERGMQYATVLARVRRGRVEADEALAIALVKCWADFDALCCNDSVIGGHHPRSNDREQAIYLCLRRR